MNGARLLLGLGLALGASGCDLDGDELLQNYDPSTGELLPVTVVDLDRVEQGPTVCTEDELANDACGLYIGDLGPSNIGTGELSGATFTFSGTGGRVCVLIDPQSVYADDLLLDADGNENTNPYMEDFPFDDGDLDMLAGRASYYTGTPGELMGDFVNTFVDANGVAQRVDLNICLQQDNHGNVGGNAGRATPEMCAFDTDEGTPYRLALYAFSVPVDDNSLKYALQIRQGDCPPTINECTLRGDRDRPEAGTLPLDVDNVEDMFCEGFE